ncbi:hypothetical protein KIH41_17615 [Litoribacter ruber]|uniref:hypothetical protein n=1 Tax=Litoribacter ruber TaxID=702568 RepID=UPI001BD91CF1|nr:hypothetical protein [Litoribacter ruber]MBT0813111.1 hypothetical protein [Litoribacter ruber]
MDLMKVVNSVAPSFESIRAEINELKIANPSKNQNELAKIYGKKIKRKYTSVGVASALPSVIPGFGTAAQIAIEAGTISADLALMFRWMASTCYGTALIYDKDIEQDFNQEFVKILGIWCGVVKGAKTATVRVGTKIAVAQFNRHVPAKIFMKINQRVGTTILTKYGTKRGGIAVGKLIPFGVGATIVGAFNYTIMNKFSKDSISYYGSFEEYIVEENGNVYQV